MEIKASSKYDWKTFKRFNRFHNSKRSSLNKVVSIIYPVAMLIYLAVFIFCAVIEVLNATMILTFCLLALLCGLVLFIEHGLPKIMFNRNKALKNSQQTFVITEDEFKVSCIGDNAKSEDALTWDAFYKTYETKEYFYFYISPNQAYIAEKDSMSNDDVNILRIHLLNVMGSKHKVVF